MTRDDQRQTGKAQRTICCQCAGDGSLESLDGYEQQAGIRDACYHCQTTGYCECGNGYPEVDHIPQCDVTPEMQQKSDALKRTAIRGFKWAKLLAEGASFEDEVIHELMKHWSPEEIETYIFIGRRVEQGEGS